MTAKSLYGISFVFIALALLLGGHAASELFVQPALSRDRIAPMRQIAQGLVGQLQQERVMTVRWLETQSSDFPPELDLQRILIASLGTAEISTYHSQRRAGASATSAPGRRRQDLRGGVAGNVHGARQASEHSSHALALDRACGGARGHGRLPRTVSRAGACGTW